MVRRPRLFSLLLLAAVLCFSDSALAGTSRSLVASVQNVSDGDSVTALSDTNTKLRIRLLGIDAPEVAHDKKPGQPYSEEAREYLDHLIGGKTIQADVYGRDQYNRILAILWDGPVNVNLLMVAMGYAEVYRGAPCIVQCQELAAAEAKARRDRAGMWAQGPKYESPSDFRRRIRLSGN